MVQFFRKMLRDSKGATAIEYGLLAALIALACIIAFQTLGLNLATIFDTINAALEYQAQGYKAIRIQCGVPGMASTYGVSKDKYFYEPADADLPRTVRQVTETVRAETRNVAGSLTAAREAAEILAGMDPTLRERILHAAATAMIGKQSAQR